MARKVIKRGITKNARKVGRQTLGTLVELKYPAGITRRYTLAVKRFFAWQSMSTQLLATDTFILEEQLCEYIQKTWEEGDPKAWIADLLSGLGRLQPHLRGTYKLAWGLYDTWAKHELAERATPLSLDLALALAGYAILQLKDLALGTGLLLGFHCMLRVCEILQLRRSDVAVVGPRLLLNLGDTKGGKRRGEDEQVIVSDSGIVALVQFLLESLCVGDRLVPLTYHQFQRKFLALVKVFGLSNKGYRLYSLRRGGATFDYRSHGLLAKTAERGRWAHLKTCRLYISEATLLLASLEHSASSLRQASTWRTALLNHLAI
jgi:integrase